MIEGFDLPPRLSNTSGEKRRVGFEFKYAGVGLQRSSEIVIDLFGGIKQIHNRFHYEVKATCYGDFSIESDSSLLKDRKYDGFLKKIGLDLAKIKIGEKLESFIEAATSDLVPFEIVTPPIPIHELESMEILRRKLFENDAKGTHAHFYATYGMQFNPEMPSFDIDTLLSYMRAFLLLYDQLEASEDVPFIRRTLPYIAEFPESYSELVLDPSYQPNLRTFMRDYLDHNPTRNRALDWLPLFAYIDRDFVFGYEVEHDLIKPRPTLHYRLPSCLIDDPNWSIASEWNKWVEIERLADDPAKMRLMCEDWMSLHEPLKMRSESLWLKRSREWIHAFRI